MTKTELQEEAMYYGSTKEDNTPDLIARINKHIDLTPKTKLKEQPDPRREAPKTNLVEQPETRREAARTGNKQIGLLMN